MMIMDIINRAMKKILCLSDNHYSYQRLETLDAVVDSKPVRAKKGFVVIYVGKLGESNKIYQVPLKYLLLIPEFEELVKKSILEGGGGEFGGPTIACSPQKFDDFLQVAELPSKFRNISLS